MVVSRAQASLVDDDQIVSPFTSTDPQKTIAVKQSIHLSPLSLKSYCCRPLSLAKFTARNA